ncbi:MAG: 6-bladed beta-propeller, partial [Candidatus Aminicenantes bacterium]|nr:6-bladed beta-propeller [Candidatus Aminicenantes bacterium]
MKSIKIIFLLLILSGMLVPTENLGVLDEVMKPSVIDIHKDRLFVVDKEQVHVYSLKDLSLIKSFGKRGEGPGEYKIIPNFPLSLKAFDEFLIVESIDKLSYFTLEGKYIKEKRKLPLLVKISEIGKNYIGRRIIQPQDGSLSTSALKIYDSEFKEVKELYKQKFLQQGAFPNLRLDLGKDFLLYQVADNKIFVEKSDKDFLIDVYDFKG